MEITWHKLGAGIGTPGQGPDEDVRVWQEESIPQQGDWCRARWARDPDGVKSCRPFIWGLEDLFKDVSALVI